MYQALVKYGYTYPQHEKRNNCFCFQGEKELLMQKPDILTTFGGSDLSLYKQFNNKHLILVMGGQFNRFLQYYSHS